MLVTNGSRGEDRARVEAALAPRSLTASRVTGVPPIVDGRLDERDWTEAETATDLVQRGPDPGALATVPTEARFLYDDEALYVGVRLFDPEPATIVAPYPRRDDETTSDWVFVELDTRLDRRTAFSFGLNPRGVQVDGVFANDVDYDVTWDGVWEGAARIDSAGWTAEFRIPFSQLTYSAGESRDADGSVPATFGMNVYRYSPHRGESSNWSPRLPSLAGIVSKFNNLELRVPAANRRLEVVPYLSGETTTPSAGPFEDGAGASVGVDLRAGLGSAFTLTAAVHPDFGQVEADPSEVNLTTFETLFTERRPFFVEDAGLFELDIGIPFATRGDSYASERAFYSRRIGRPPRLSPPATASSATSREVPGTSLLGAAKLTGRTAGGWSVGALGTVTGAEEARFVDESGRIGSLAVEPLTTAAVGRVSRDFRSGGSAVGAIVTFLDRSRMTPELRALLPTRALAFGVDARHRFRDDEYEAKGFVVASDVRGSADALTSIFEGPGHYAQRPDRRGSAPNVGEAATGYAAQSSLAKIGGDHWRWTIASRAASPGLELNDLGFERNADSLVLFGALTYQNDRPGPLFRRWSVGSNQLAWEWSYAGERRAALFDVSASGDLESFWGGSVSFDHELAALQPEALRGGPALRLPPRNAFAVSIYSDTRRMSQFTFDAKALRESATEGRALTLSPAVTFRPNDRLTLTLAPAFDSTTNPWQYVGAPSSSGEAPGSGPRYIVARLDQRTLSLTARADLAFTSHLTLQIYAQPFVSAGRFDRYGEVVAPRAPRVEDRVRLFDAGKVTSGDGTVRIDADPGTGSPLLVADPAYHLRSLRANVVLRWEYRPGSTLYAVWTQSREDTRASPFFDGAGDIVRVFGARPDNVFLVKLSYWFAPRR